MSIRYIGSKARLASEIIDLAGGPTGGGRFVDLFCGTGVVSREAAGRGWPVLANDLLPSSAILTRAQLVTDSEASFAELGGYGEAVSCLNAAPPREGIFAQEYAPDERQQGRLYFTRENARRLDGMRDQLFRWTAEGRITAVERSLLLGDLIQTTNAVANTAGTYGCFLRQFAPNALRSAQVAQRELLARSEDVEVCVGDAGALKARPEDVVYLDPPYTKRQYAAYYHILETLVAGDEPVVEGVTGLRPWKDRASEFCYKRRALPAMLKLVRNLSARRVLISYSNDGHIDISEMKSALKTLGDVVVHSLGEIRRYTPNDESRANGEQVREVVLEVRRRTPRLLAPGAALARPSAAAPVGESLGAGA